MVSILNHNPLLVLFLICGIGWGVGSLPIGKKRIKLGSAAVFFVGLVFGAAAPQAELPAFLGSLGLIFLMYMVGNSSSDGLAQAFGKENIKPVALGLGTILFTAVLASACSPLFHQTGGFRAAIFSGVLSNSTGLAAIEDALVNMGASGHALHPPIVGFSLSYPASLFVPILLLPLIQWLLRIDLKEEAKADPEYIASHQPLRNASILVERDQVHGNTLGEVLESHAHPGLVLGEHIHDGKRELATTHTKLNIGDVLTVVGTTDTIEALTKKLGSHLDANSENSNPFELHRIFVSNKSVVGVSLQQLHLSQEFGFKITRVRRGDIEFVPDENTKLQLGDRLRVQSLRDNGLQVKKLFGDSFYALGNIDFLSISAGIVLGILIGLIPIPVPGGLQLKLGLAGGPLIAGLVLARFSRTGSFIWKVPDPASRILYQLGLVFYSAYLGSQGGNLLWQSIRNGSGALPFAVSILLCFVTGIGCLWIGCRLLKLKLNRALGVLAGLLTQPIVLDGIEGAAGNEMASAPFAAIFPICLIAKILLSQVLLYLLK